MAHHPHGVGRLADFLPGNLLHHRGLHFIRATRPGIDHLVVAFARGDQAVLILLFELLHLGSGAVDQFLLLGRDDHVVLAEGNARLRRVTETKTHQAVTEDHAFLLATVTVNRVDDVRHDLLGQLAVDQRERQRGVARQDLRHQHPARRGHDGFARDLALGIDILDTRADLVMQLYGARAERIFHFAHAGEGRRTRNRHLPLVIIAVLVGGRAEFRGLEAEIVQPQHDIL